MLALEDALQRILSALPPPVAERVPLSEGDARVLAENIPSPVDLPHFDNSAMDGYAVRAEDVRGATAERPVKLRVLGKTAAGEVFSGKIGPGSCVRLFTGSPVPAGADAVVMQEDTRPVEADPEFVLVADGVGPFENIRLRGVDTKTGDVLAAAGARLQATHLGLLAAVGVEKISVGRQPTVSLLATGSELLEPGQPLTPGKIHESNRLMLAPLVRAAGGRAGVLPLVADTPEAMRDALKRAFTHSDIVVTSGGVSVGEFDFVKTSFEQLGGQIEFWKISMRPGKPFVFGRWQDKFLFGLPGNPVSAFVTFLLLVRPALLRWQGASEVSLPSFPGVLAEPMANRGDRRHFVRVKVNASGQVFSAGLQASHAQASLALANGLIEMTPDSAIPAGTNVRVLRWD